MLVKLTVHRETMEEIASLFTHYNWDLNEESCFPLYEDEENEQFEWTLDITREQADTLYYHTDLSENDFVVQETTESDGYQERTDSGHQLKQLRIMVTSEQEITVRKCLDELGITPQVIGNNKPDESSYNHPPGYRINPTPGRDKCPNCLSQPCVIDDSNRQAWWSKDSKAPDELNSIHRKECYYKFWTMLYHRGLWCDPEYIARKKAAGGQPYIKRELMPDCVLHTVRKWYPNPDHIPYMGHKWL